VTGSHEHLWLDTVLPGDGEETWRELTTTGFPSVPEAHTAR